MSASDSRTDSALCLTETSLLENVTFTDEATAREILRTPDGWARQLSPFEMAARQRTVEETDLNELLTFLGTAAFEWSSEERDYWRRQAERVSEAMAGLNLVLTDVSMVKTSGEEEFNFAYSRNRAIMIPDGRVQISGDDKRDFSFLSHEVFHYLSAQNPAVRDSLFGLLGFERINGFEVPSGLERRRMSNPGAHSYEHALAVEVDSQTHYVVPVIQSTIPLEELIRFSQEGPPVLLDVIEIVLVSVEVDGGAVRREHSAAALTYRIEETDWRSRMQRNTSYAIHPEEVMADNFALLLEWRSNGIIPTETPAGFPVNDVPLLMRMQEVLTSGCPSQPDP